MCTYEIAEATAAASRNPGTRNRRRGVPLRGLAEAGVEATAGVVVILLPGLLIAANWIAGDKVIIPHSMSASYYTSARDLFVGLLCALGVFLIFWVQYICTLLAGAAGLVVAFCPAAPPPQMGTESAWINDVHHIAASALIVMLGIFCFALHRTGAAEMTKLDVPGPADQARRGARQQVPRWPGILYSSCGSLVLLSGGAAMYTDLWPASWSASWQSVYLFETVAVCSFGIAWITAAAVRATTIAKPAAACRARRAAHPAGDADPGTANQRAGLDGRRRGQKAAGGFAGNGLGLAAATAMVARPGQPGVGLQGPRQATPTGGRWSTKIPAGVGARDTNGVIDGRDVGAVSREARRRPGRGL